MIREKLQLNRKFLVIESPIPFEIYCPEQEDGVKRRQGSWQMTIHDLLTKSHYPLNPIFNLELIYDETLLAENETVSWYTTDLNLGEALRGIDGQLVTLGDSLLDTRIMNFPEKIDTNKVFSFINNRILREYFYSYDLGISVVDFLKEIVPVGSTNIVLNELNFLLTSVITYKSNEYAVKYGVFNDSVLYENVSNTDILDASIISNYIGSLLRIVKDDNNNITQVMLEILRLEENNFSFKNYVIDLLNTRNVVRFLKFKFCY